MIKTIFLLLALQSAAFGQHLAIAPDTSSITFPNKVTIRLLPLRGQKFQLNSKAVKTLLTQVNYLYSIQQLSTSQIGLLQSQISMKDSSILVLQNQLSTWGARHALFEKGYGELKVTASAYDEQIRALIEDLRETKRNERRRKRTAFFKGLIGGIAGGIILGLTVSN